MDRNRNSSKICGKKDTIDPTPAITPSQIKLTIQSCAPSPVSDCATHGEK